MKKYTHVIWDWNGTLFDDAEWCVTVMNKMLRARNMKTLSGLAEYREVFCFPVIEYYKKAGFDFDLEREPFESLAAEFISLYLGDGSGACPLHKNADMALTELRKQGVRQVILSASEKRNLLSQLENFDISGYFDEILGVTDIYANDKIGLGLDYISRVKAESAVFIGDTLHDYETAAAIGADCILISGGHQSSDILRSCGAPVLGGISEVLEYIL